MKNTSFSVYSKANIISCLFITLFLFFIPSKGYSQETIISTAVASEKVDEWLDKTFAELEVLKNRTIYDGNLAAEQRIYQIELALLNLQSQLSKDVNSTIGLLDYNIQNYIASIDKIVNGAISDIGELAERTDLLIHTNMNDLCSKLIFCPSSKINYSIRYVKNTAINPNSIGNPTVEIAGSALKEGVKVEVFLDGKALNDSNIATPHTNIRKISIPRAFLKFKDFEIARPKLRVLISGNIPNPDKTSLLQPWKPDEIEGILIDYKLNLVLLPKNPVKISIVEHAQKEKWSKCSNCVAKYEGSTKNTLITEHKLEIGANYRFKEVLIKPQEIYTPTKYDHYFMFCTELKEVELPNGKKEIYTRCFDGAINRSCAGTAANFYNSKDQKEREKLISYNYPCYVKPLTNRKVIFEVELEKKEIGEEDIPLRIELREGNHNEQNSNLYLNYGEHWSGKLVNNQSGYRIKVTPTFGNENKDFFYLTPETNQKTVNNFFSISSKIERNGSSSRIKISVN